MCRSSLLVTLVCVGPSEASKLDTAREQYKKIEFGVTVWSHQPRVPAPAASIPLETNQQHLYTTITGDHG